MENFAFCAVLTFVCQVCFSKISFIIKQYRIFSIFLTLLRSVFIQNNLIICNNLLCAVGAMYFDKSVFREGDGLDTSLGHPSLPRIPFGFAQHQQY